MSAPAPSAPAPELARPEPATVSLEEVEEFLEKLDRALERQRRLEAFDPGI